MRVLIVENERMLADALAVGLRREALAVDVVYDGAAALDQIAVTNYDVIVLDRDIPGVSGDDVCRAVVSSDAAQVPRVVMLTAADRVTERVAGLALGADDYVTKPFAFAELVARIRAVARRAPRPTPPRLEYAGLSLDPVRRQVFRDGVHIPLALKEFAVLAELLRADGAVVSAEDLLERVWDAHVDPFTNAVRVTVQTLRRKLGEPPLIHTVRGAGYQIR